MTDDASNPKSGAAQGARENYGEATEKVRRQILLGETSDPPRRSTQFQKGQSGNPKGRPRKSGYEDVVGAVTAQDKLFLKEARRLRKIMEGGQEAELTTEQIIVRATIQSAVKGNPIAQRNFLDRADRAAIAERKAIEENKAKWRIYVEHQNEQIADARAKGAPEPNPLPHPEDIIFEPGDYVRFCGPTTEAGLKAQLELREIVRMLILQNYHDERILAGKTFDKTTKLPDGAYMLAQCFNKLLCKRLQLTDADFFLIELALEAKTKRELMTLVVKGWASIGRRHPRGKTFPDFSAFEKKIEKMIHFLGNLSETLKNERSWRS